MKEKQQAFIIKINSGIDFPRNTSEIVRNAILAGDKDKAAAWLESLPDESFLSVFTTENRKLLSLFLKGEIKKKRGPKQEQGFKDFLVFAYYKTQRAKGLNRAAAIRETVAAIEKADCLPGNDLLRYATADRLWNTEDLSGPVEEIISKLDKIYNLIPEE